ncbi:MAG TPA: alpha/beta hydrolase [Bacteroidia bacterium]|nr:alpha/beta hydrolase [Bacteroidia bacterium]
MSSKPVILLLHGALGSGKQFVDFEKILSEYFEVHILNFTGHYGNDPVDVPFSIDLFCNDVLNYIHKLNLDSVNLFGYSMGGYVAMALAMKFPDKVKAVLTLATKFDWNPENAKKEVSMMDAEVMMAKIPEFVNILERRFAPRDWKVVLENTKAMILNLGYHPLNDADLKNLSCRIRVCVGDRDKMVSIDSTQEVFRKLKNGSLLVLPDTAHPFECVNIERLKFEMVNFFCLNNQ